MGLRNEDSTNITKEVRFSRWNNSKTGSSSPDLKDWWTIQALLVSWIKMTIDPMLRATNTHREVAKELWDHLKKRFAVMNGLKIQQIKAELACCK